MLNGKARPATASFFLKRKFLSFQVILSQRSAHRGSRFLPALIRHANTPHPEVNSDPSPERMSSNWFIKKLPNFPFSHSFFPPIPHRMGFSVLAFFFKLESTCIGLHIKVELHLQSCEGCFDVVVALASAALQRLIPPPPALNSVWKVLYRMKICSKKETPPLYTGHTQKRENQEPHMRLWVLNLLCIRTCSVTPWLEIIAFRSGNVFFDTAFKQKSSQAFPRTTNSLWRF